MQRVWLLSFMLFMGHSVAEKVLIITHSCNRPDFIEMQHRAFDALLQDEYTFVVFNDARDVQMERSIQQICEKCGITCMRVPQEIHTRPYLERLPGDPLHRPNIRHANCVQYSLDVLGFDFDGIVMILDSDMFLTRPLSLTDYMQDKDIAAYMKGSGAGAKKVTYICPALSIFNMHTLPEKKAMNFNCGMVNGLSVDSGGYSYYYLAKHPELKVQNVTVLWCHNLYLGNIDIHKPIDQHTPDKVKAAFYRANGFNELEIAFLLKKPSTVDFFFDKHFLHYHGGTNYHNLPKDYHQKKTALINDFLDSAISAYSEQK